MLTQCLALCVETKAGAVQYVDQSIEKTVQVYLDKLNVYCTALKFLKILCRIAMWYRALYKMPFVTQLAFYFLRLYISAP